MDHGHSKMTILSSKTEMEAETNLPDGSGDGRENKREREKKKRKKKEKKGGEKKWGGGIWKDGVIK